MEESIDAYLQGYSVVQASDPNRPDSETRLQQGEIKDGKRGHMPTCVKCGSHAAYWAIIDVQPGHCDRWRQ